MDEKFLADRLRFLRNEKGVSAREMSLAIGQCENYINKIETGKRSVSMEVFFYICEYLQVSPAKFFAETLNNNASSDELLIDSFHKLTKEQAGHIYALTLELAKMQSAPHGQHEF